MTPQIPQHHDAETRQPFVQLFDKSTSDSRQINQLSDCNYHFSIDLESHGISFGSKSIGKW